MKKRNIVLIGPMGTGKSRAAQVLADGLGFQLADTDRIIKMETGMKIAQFYKQKGEKEFNKKEMEIINKVRYYHEAVIAMGGNFPMTEERFKLLSEYGIIVLLYARPFRLVERVKKSIGKRPTMDYTDVEKFVKYMLGLWYPWKKRADLSINTTLSHPVKTALEIARYLDRNKVQFEKRKYKKDTRKNFQKREEYKKYEHKKTHGKYKKHEYDKNNKKHFTNYKKRHLKKHLQK